MKRTEVPSEKLVTMVGDTWANYWQFGGGKGMKEGRYQQEERRGLINEAGDLDSRKKRARTIFGPRKRK
jgi:hypothetical protein